MPPSTHWLTSSQIENEKEPIQIRIVRTDHLANESEFILSSSTWAKRYFSEMGFIFPKIPILCFSPKADNCPSTHLSQSLLTIQKYKIMKITKRRKCTFSPYILTFFHFSPYTLFFPFLVPKPINARHLSP